MNHGTASSDGGSSVPSVTRNSNNRESKSDAKTAKYIDKLTVSIEELANKNLQAASMTARETKKDREQRNQAVMLEIAEKREDRKQRQKNSREDRQHQETADLKRRLEDLWSEKRKVRRLAAECTYGDNRNDAMAAYYKSEIEEIELHEKHLNDQLQELREPNDISERKNMSP